MGKWDFLRKKYPRLPVDAGYGQQLDAVKGSTVGDVAKDKAEDLVDLLPIMGKKLSDLCEADLEKVFLVLRRHKQMLEGKMKLADIELEAVTRLFIGLFEDSGTASTTFIDGVSIGHSVEPYPFLTDKAAFLSWVRENGMDDMLTMNYQTMASTVKDILEGKNKSLQTLPPGIDVYMKDKLTCRGSKKGGNDEQ